MMKQSNTTLVVSPTEVELLKKLAPGVHVTVLGNVHDVNVARERPVACQNRKGLLFVGNFNHIPNIQAVDALVQDVLPKLYTQLSAVEKETMPVHIVGSATSPNPDPSSRLQSTPFNLKFHGWVSDAELRLLYRTVKVVVAPLMSGAGVKGKINQAMLYGVPVVATPIAAEGMHLVDGVNMMLAINPQQFVDKLLTLYNNCSLWEKIVLGGYKNIQMYYNVEANIPVVANIMTQLGFNTDKHVPRC